jgi:tetratricopeptide (TPR) repeat protein
MTAADDLARRGHAILREALELDVAARRAFVESRSEGDPELRACALRLLAAASMAEGFLESPAWTPSEATLAPPSGGRVPIGEGTRLGGFTVIAHAASGGMGDVYRAEQDSPHRVVALKVVRRAVRRADDAGGRRAQERFAIETEALGRLQHPNVAQVYASGVTRVGDLDVPYVALEWIDGARTIVQAARERGLSREARLLAFLDAVAAVRHAHGRGVIHRDLKPANVLLGVAGVVKVIDFGVALLTDRAHTATLAGEFVGTLSSMSPEQCAGGDLDLDVRADVYGLGTILYELLADRPPFDVSREPLAQAVRTICEVPAPPIDGLDRDLAAIVSTALAKDRTRRYASAEALGRDVRHWLDRRPIEARAPTAWRQLGLFVRRHRAPVAFAALAASALVVGTVATGLALARALRAETDLRVQLSATEAAQRAEKERADELAKVSAFQSEMLGQIDVASAGAALMADIRARFVAATEKAGIPVDEGEAMHVRFGADLSRVNATDAAAAMIDRTILQPAVATIDAAFREQPRVDASLRQALADLYRTIGLYRAASPLQHDALSIRLRLLGEGHPLTLESMDSLGVLLQKEGKPEEALPYAEAALAGFRRVLGDDHPSTLRAINNMGTLLQAKGMFAAAEPYYREALDRRAHVLGYGHRDTLSSLANMGFVLVDLGRPAEAERYYREALKRRRETLGDDHRDTIISINNLGYLLQSRGDLAAAEPLLREALESFRRVYGNEHQDTLTAVNNMGFLLQAERKFDEAEGFYREALDSRRRTLGPSHPETLVSINNMGFLMQTRGQFAEAEPYYREALETRRRVLGAEHRDTLMSVSNLGSLLRSLGKLEDAEPYYREAVETSRRTLGPEHPDTLVFAVKLGGLLRARAKHAEAVETLAAVEDATRRSVAGGNVTPLTTLLLALGRSRVELGFDSGRFALAEADLLEAHALLAKARGPTHKDTIGCAKSVVDLYDAWSRAEPERGLEAKAAEWRRAATPPAP